MYLNFRQGIITYQKDSGGKPSYLTVSLNNATFVNLVVSPTPFTVTFAHGESDYLATFDKTIENAWGPMVAGVDNYLYLEMDNITGAVTQGLTTIKPEFNNQEPARVPGMSWFNSDKAKMFVWQPQSGKWVERIRVFVGKVPKGAARDVQMYTLGSQVNLNTNSKPGYPMLDSQLRPLRTSTGEFLTTNTDVRIKVTVGTSGVLAVPTNSFIPVRAGENIPAMSLVYFSDSDVISLASSDPALINRRTPVGVMQDALATNEVGALTQYGDIVYDQWDWTGHFGKPVYSDNTGKITLTRPQGLMAYRVGFIKNKNTIIFGVDAETEPQVYQVNTSDFVMNAVSPLNVTDTVNAIGERVLTMSIQPSVANMQAGYMSAAQAAGLETLATQMITANQKINQLDVDKANVIHVHAIADVNGLQAALDSKFPANGNFDGRYSLINHNHNGVYAPIMHTHAIADIDGLNARLAQKSERLTGMIPFTRVFESVDQTGPSDVGNGDNLVQALGKKANTIHTHTITQVTGLQAALDGKANEMHTHEMGAVNGLQDALDGKANVVHTHTIAQVTGLQAALDDKSDKGHTHSILEVNGLQAALTGLQTNIDAKTLASLTDTTITSPQANQSLIWNGSKWVNGTPKFGIDIYNGTTKSHFTEGLAWSSADGSVTVTQSNQAVGGKNLTTVNFSASIDKLTDVTLTGLATNHIMTWDGSKWTNKPLVVSNLGLSGLTDVNITSPVNPSAYLGWDSTSSKWVNRIIDLKEISGLLIGTPTTGQTLVYDAGQSSFVSNKLNLSQLGDVNTAGATNGKILRFDGTTWKPADQTAGGKNNLSELNDVTLTTPGGGQLLSFNGMKWVNVAPSTLQGITLGQLADVNVTNPSTGQILGWSGSAWTTRAAPLGLPTGGTVGQILSKSGATDGQATWAAAPLGLPTGGTVGQMLTKNSTTNGDARWSPAPVGVPGGGPAGSVLTKSSAADGAVVWATPATGIPDGGDFGQALVKASGNNGDVIWASAKVLNKWSVYDTTQRAQEAITANALYENDYLDIMVDSRYGNRRTLNKFVGGVITFIRYADVDAYVGSGPGEIPTNSLLGRQAFADEVGVTQVYQSPYTSKPGDVWREFTNNTTTVLKFHGFDGVIRTRSETWT